MRLVIPAGWLMIGVGVAHTAMAQQHTTAGRTDTAAAGRTDTAAAGRTDTAAADSRIHVQHDPDAFVTTISIRATDGRVAWSDVLRAMARARGSDDSALQGVLPEKSFELTSRRWRLVLSGLDLALGSKVSFRVERATAAGQQPRLVIRLDRAALLASKRRFKRLLRDAFSPLSRGGPPQGLELDDGWQRSPADRKVVVFVHGLSSRPETLGGLASDARRQRLPCGTFAYPNDQPIAESAELLARGLRQLAKDHPSRGVSLVTHSMGGLVSRAVIEDPRLDPGNVRQLIMIAPPNHGSGLARFGFALELWDQIRNRQRREEVGVFYAWLEDGLSEASTDLRPGSPFLKQLNSRGRNPRVRYTIFLGTNGPLSPAELASLRKSVAAAGRRSRWVQFFGPNVDRWLADLDEVVDGKGDGAVALKRGRLEGVDDTVVLRFSHIGVLRTPARGDVLKVRQGVLQRLKIPGGESRPEPAADVRTDES